MAFLQSHPVQVLSQSFQTGSFASAPSGSGDLEESLLRQESEEVSSLHKPALAGKPPPAPAEQGDGWLPPGLPAAANGGGGGCSEAPGALPVSHLPPSESSPPVSAGSSLLVSIVILAKTIMGAGMAALPRAFVLLGLPAAGGFLLLIAGMNHWSVEALTLGTLATGRTSYPQVVRLLCGRTAALLLQLSLVLRCAGLIIVYMIITADVLAGPPGEPGLLCDILGSSDASAWCANRPLLAGAVALLCMAPLVAPKRLAATAVTSWLGLAAVAVWVGVTAALVVVAVAQGVAHPLRWLPDWSAFGGGPAEVGTQLAAVIPILATAYTCQMTVHFIIRDLRCFSQRRVAITSGAATALCTLCFLAVALGSQVVFGPDLPADVLTQFSAAQLSRFVPPWLARALYVAVRASFLLSVVSIVPMQMAPFRESLSRLLTGSELSGTAYHVVTYASLALFYFVAMHAGSIWVPIQFVGATAGALIAFIFPAWIALAALRAREPAALASQRYWQWGAWALVALGVVQAVAGVTATLFLPNRQGGQDGAGSSGAALGYLF